MYEIRGDKKEKEKLNAKAIAKTYFETKSIPGDASDSSEANYIAYKQTKSQTQT